MDSETPLAKARGLGPAGEGAERWWLERMTSVATLMLLVWLLVSLLRLADLGYGSIIEWLSVPYNAVAMMLLIVSSFWHGKLGMQVIVEDYVHEQGNKFFLLLLIDFAIVAGGALGLFCVLKIALGGDAA